MALYHEATLSPTKAEMISAWVPTQPWFPRTDAPVQVIGAFRFDDPEGTVGMETHLVTVGDTVLQVPLTYRPEPVDAYAHALIGEMEHSALGTRWVYDGLHDERYVLMLAAVAMTGQGEALGMVVYGDQWFIAPSQVRLQGGGWSHERVSVDGFSADARNGESVRFANERFDMVFHRRVNAGSQPAIGLTALCHGHPERLLLAEISER